MNTMQVDAETDPILMSQVAALGAAEGPCVSLFLPTHRFGPGTASQDPLRLRNLVEAARSALSEGGTDRRVIDEIMNPVASLIDDTTFWQHQADGLAVFAGPGRFERYRVARPLTEEATVSSAFRVRPLLASVSSEHRCFVLAVSQNAVQLFETTDTTISRLDAESIPVSMAEALSFEDPERQLQSHSVGGSDVAFHGHGAGAEVDNDEIERFLRAVDRGVLDAIGGGTNHPLVLAGDASYLPIYRSVTRYPNVAAEAVAGNAEHRSPTELHTEAWKILQPQIAAETEAAIARYRSVVGTGNTASTVSEIVSAARQGRVAQLFVSDGAPVWGHIDDDGDVSLADQASITAQDLIDRAVFETLTHGGELVVADPEAFGADAAAALLRY